MSSITSTAIYLIVILSMGSKADDFMKDSICEDQITQIDAIVNFKEYRYWVLGIKFFEYDYNNQFRRRGFLLKEVSEFYISDKNQKTNPKSIRWNYQSGVFIPEVDPCAKYPEWKNCSELKDTLSQTLIVPIYNAFLNKYEVVTKKFDETSFKYNGILNCSEDMITTIESPQNRVRNRVPTNSSSDANVDANGGGNGEGNGDENGGQNDYYDQDVGDTDPKNCGPFGFIGRTNPTEWLLKGLPSNKRHKFLPLYFDAEKLELIVVLNKEYEMFGENPSLIRTHSVVYWKSLIHDYNYTKIWNQRLISDDYTYTAFLKEKENVYLIGEKFQEKFQSGKRGDSVMLPFDVQSKQLIDKTSSKSPLDLFGCSVGLGNTVAYIVISVMILILVVVIGGWILACYCFYGRDQITTYNESLKIVDT